MKNVPGRTRTVLGVQVGLGEDERLGDLGAAGEDLRQPVAEGADHEPDLLGVDDVAVELAGGIGEVGFELGLPFPERAAVAPRLAPVGAAAAQSGP